VIALVRSASPTTPAGWTPSAGRSRARRRCRRWQPSSPERLPHFGRWQDAMWPGEPWLYHAQISAALNLKLLNPREVVAAAEAAYRAGRAPLAGVEGFIRQILGWREYVRGIYWTQMPGYAELNALDAQAGPARLVLDRRHRHGLPARRHRPDAGARLRPPHPAADGHRPVRAAAGRAAAAGARLVPGVYVDAVEWVELPNTLGMSQYADGGLMASKPYVATGKYIQRMGNHCQGCRYDPAQRTGAAPAPSPRCTGTS
jgi:deoxyribodipyrimidine photolyase-related protein